MYKFEFKKKVLVYKKKITSLRNLLKKEDCNYYLLPRTDSFQNEFISEENERVKWLTGFTGSSAFVIISPNENIIFTDGRYINQIKTEVDKKLFRVLDIKDNHPILWLKNKVKAQEKIFLDSWLFTINEFKHIKKVLNKKNCEVFFSNQILLDKIWKKKKKIIIIRFLLEKKNIQEFHLKIKLRI